MFGFASTTHVGPAAAPPHEEVRLCLQDPLASGETTFIFHNCIELVVSDRNRLARIYHTLS